MLIKKDKGNDGLSRVGSFLKRVFWNRKAAVVYILIIFLAALFIGTTLSSYKSTGELSPFAKAIGKAALTVFGMNDEDGYQLAGALLNNPFGVPGKFFKGLTVKPEHIDIDIAFEDFQRLAYKREIALEQGILITSDEDFVPASIRYNGETVDVRLRLKGDWTYDNLTGDKWALRVKVRNDNTLFGMRIFSLHAPVVRNYIGEWLFHRTLEKEGLIGLRYKFIDVTINGDHRGIYALEEQFDKRLIENNSLREGPIIKFNEGQFWEEVLLYYDISDEPAQNASGAGSYYASDIDSFQTDTTLADPSKYELFQKAVNLLEAWRAGALDTSEAFDADKTARFFAVIDLMGAEHGVAWHNMRFYYNPVTSLLEPIGFDANAGLPIEKVIGIESPGSYLKRFFEDNAFYEKYVRELERVSDPAYLDGLLDELDDEMRENLSIIYKDYPWYTFSNEVLYRNQEYIRNVLNPVKGAHAYIREVTDGGITLEVGNVQSMPVEVLSLTIPEVETFRPVEKTILPSRSPGKLVEYQTIQFMFPAGFTWADEYKTSLTLDYQLLGTSRLRGESVFPWSYLPADFLDSDFIRQGPNVEEFDFLVTDNASREIYVKSGNWEISKNLIIPAGYTVIAGEGTRLDLKNRAAVLSHSPLLFQGTEEYPVIVTSSDASGQGITVLQAGGRSVLENVVFQNLSAPSISGWELTGAITFYESPVYIARCRFLSNTYGDDILNIICSEFSITESLFENALFDALDIDFGQGTITGSSFINPGNDGMDVSGTTVSIVDCYVTGAGDKGVSSGENSRVTIRDIKIKDSNIGVASKDLSIVTMDKAVISGCNYGLAAYQKKPEYGPAVLTASSVELTDNVQITIVEEGSEITLNGQLIDDFQQNVYQTLLDT